MLVVFDTETTGLTAGINEMVQLSATVIDETNWTRLTSFTSLIKPRRIGTINADSMKVHGLDLDELLAAPPSEVVRGQFLDWWGDLAIDGKIKPCGWNYSFDERFLRMFFGSHEYDSLFYYKAVDVYPIAWVAQKQGKLPADLELSLDNVAEELGLIHKKHDAEGDVYVTWKILQELCK